MARLSILVGIGLMMVGILSYALLPERESAGLVPAIAGVIMALGGWITIHRDGLRKHLMHVNALIALILLVWVAVKIPADWEGYSQQQSFFVADIDVLCLSAVFVYCAVKSFIAARKARATK